MRRDPLNDKQDGPPPRASFSFRLAAGSATLFVITIFSVIATMFGEPDHPATRFFDRYGFPLLMGQAFATVGLGILAMTLDRRATLRELRDRSERDTDQLSPTTTDPSLRKNVG